MSGCRRGHHRQRKVPHVDFQPPRVSTRCTILRLRGPDYMIFTDLTPEANFYMNPNHQGDSIS